MSASKKAKEKASDPSTEQQPQLRKKIVWQVIILAVVLIILGAIALTAFFTSKTTFRSTVLGPNKSSGLNSMTDAKLACDKKVTNKYGPLLQSSPLNYMSSRYEEDFGGYKLFYDVRVYRNEERNSGVERIMFKCFIFNDGDISETGVIKTTPPPAKASRKIDGNFFGF